MDERHEAIEECERLFRRTHVRVSTENIGLAKLSEGLELIRIGTPLRPEFAAWRYASEFAIRRNRSNVIAGSTIAGAGIISASLGALVGPAALQAGAASIVVVPGVTTILAVIPIVGVLAARDYLENDRVVARFSQRHHVVNIRAKHVGDIEFEIGVGGQATLRIPHDRGWARFTGTRAIHATSVILANTNRAGASRRSVQDAVNEIEKIGTAEGFMEAAARRGVWRGLRPVSVLNSYRALGAMHLSATERLALEMSMQEETERRAMYGELAILREAWRAAEEIALIADGLLPE
jgi:hypothetical protein